MAKYQEQHYEDVAKLLHGYRPLPQVPIEVLIEAFANLFAADNPRTCGQCGRFEDTTELCLPDEPTIEHQFSSGGGFDRERFLKACGLSA